MASATGHPNHQLISSEDVEGTEVYDGAGNNIGEIDHMMIDKTSGRVAARFSGDGRMSQNTLVWEKVK
jgi:hypothetical protein